MGEGSDIYKGNSYACLVALFPPAPAGLLPPPPLPPYSLYHLSPVSLPFPKPFTHH